MDKYLSSVRKYNKNFIDKLRIQVRGGTGGSGRPSCGGVGGPGGDVYIVGSTNANMKLNHLKAKYPKKRFTADAGQPSGRRSLAGFKGRNIYIQVPHGVDIIDANNGNLIGEISSATDKVMVARGGKGATFSNQYVSEKGETRTVNIDLKLISDFGFVGFPNAGKSSLLRQLSNARPAVSPFPFTTIKPEIGILEFVDHRQISLADLPGIIEGAHLNEGRGHVFLKHAERSHCLLMVVDVEGFQLSPAHKSFDCFETIQLLGKELELYDPVMLRKPMVLAINKMDLPDSKLILEETLEKLEENHKDKTSEKPSILEKMKFKCILPVSAETGEGTEELKASIRQTIDDTAAPTHPQLPPSSSSSTANPRKKLSSKSKLALR